MKLDDYQISIDTMKPTYIITIADGFKIAMYKKIPRRFHRFMMKLCFGFKFEEVNNEEK